MNARTIETALILIKQGLPCFPCAADKRPTTPHGFKEATNDAKAVRQLWLRHPGALIGVPTGQPSGFDVLDIDARNGGTEWFASHKNLLPGTRVHRTRSGGLHFLFKHRPGLRCSAGQISSGVDVRADGGYVIWWPAAGCEVLASIAISDWPGWVLGKLRPPNEARQRAVVPNERALLGLVRAVAQSQPGERNRITFWAACRAGEMVASGLLAAEIAMAIIVEAAARSGLPYAEAQRTVRSGLRVAGGRVHG